MFTDIENVEPENINTIYIKKNLIHFTYDDNGNLVERLSPSDTTGYSYDAENRLIRVDLPGGAYEEYVYDGFGQRVKVLKNGNLYRSYVYDNLFESVVIRDSDNNTQFITRGLGYPGGIGGLVGFYDETNGSASNYFNHRGDLIGAGALDEDILFSTDYDAFGNTMEEAGINHSDFGFSSKELDDATELYNFGGRYYAPDENRWMTRDPVGFEAGFNLYEFVGNNPVMFIDPYGYRGIPPDIEQGLRDLSDYLNSTEGVITRETVINAIEQMSRTGQLAANFMSRVSGLARAGSVFTGVLQTFLTPEGAAAMRGAIQLTQALQRENEMVRRHNLLGCGQRLRPGQRRIARAARSFRRSIVGRILYWPN
nr:RHS repeat-associated core domain-containing protein [Bacteroidota bacterium]